MAAQTQDANNYDQKSALTKAVDLVNKLYEFRDNYFEEHSIDNALHRTDDVTAKLKSTLESLDRFQDSISNNSMYLMLRGKALNVLPNYDKNAEEALAKAVKLDPGLVEAWNNLGEIYWKHADVESAKNCFMASLNHSKNKVSLRNLSMVLRQLGKDDSERLQFIEESVDKAKEAVQMDIKDGTSWFILGNAYLSLFFSRDQNPKILKQCMSAYQQAERDIVTRSNPDLHFNRATAYKYQEEYELALEEFQKASMFDPTWVEPKEKRKRLLDYLASVHDFVHNKGKLKDKRLKSLLSTIRSDDLGPYSGGSYTGPHGNSVQLEEVSLKSLQTAMNTEKVILGKVVCSLTSDDPVPFTFCIVDQAGTCMAVNVYNIAPGYGVKIGDSVAIPEPYVTSVCIDTGIQKLNFQSIRVDTPVVLVVNGKKLGFDKQAPTVLNVSTKSE